MSDPTIIDPKKKDFKPKVNLKYQRDKDREPVKGIFRFHECPGGSMDFVYREYKEDEVERFNFVDGQMYTIPLGVAKHLNKNGWYPVHNYSVDENGKSLQRIGQKVRRFSFQSLEFVDITDFPNQANEIITVEKV